MLSKKEIEGINAVVSDIENSKDFIKEEIYRQFTQKEIDYSFAAYSEEGLLVLIERLKEIDEFELCRKITNLIESRKNS